MQAGGTPTSSPPSVNWLRTPQRLSGLAANVVTGVWRSTTRGRFQLKETMTEQGCSGFGVFATQGRRAKMEDDHVHLLSLSKEVLAISRERSPHA